MENRNQRREAAVDRMADYLLAKGLGAATLRPLAAAAGTSDRMLLYYFADRNEVLTATLHRVVERMLVQLDAAVPAGPLLPFPVLLADVRAVLASNSIKPYMHLWLDLSSGAARGFQPQLEITGAIVDGFLAWITSRLEVESENGRVTSAALFFACIEGLLVLEAIGRPSIADSVAMELSVHLGRPKWT